MKRKIKFVNCLCYIVIVIFASCSKNDDQTNNIDNFYNGADATSSIDKLEGVWTILGVEFDGRLVEVPVNYENCGRDFFVYSEGGTYTEYLFQSSACEPQINRLNYELNSGVITLKSALGQSDDFVLIKLNSEELVFKSRFDIDEDGVLDVIVLYAEKYEATEYDLVAESFVQNGDEAFENLISFVWQPYQGFNQFDRYEIYRSAGDNCSKANSELITTITNPEITEFTDLSPPVAEKFCYFIKIYTDKGLLAESLLRTVEPGSNIQIEAVSVFEPVVLNNQIELSWEESDSPYFSHYEVVVADNATTSTPQEFTIAVINDKAVTAYTDTNPPYFKNPIYRVFVYNIFGNKSASTSSEVTIFWEVPFKRDEVIDLDQINSYEVDKEEPVVYFYGRSRQNNDNPNIYRYNYSTLQTESISDVSPPVLTGIPIKLSRSPNGKEIVINQGIELYFYDAVSMEFKYAIDPEEVFSISDFTYFEELDLWIITDSDAIYTLKRDNTNLRFVDSRPHFSAHHGSGRYQAFVLQNDRLLVGHASEPNSMVYTIDMDGTILSTETVGIKVNNWNNDKTLFNFQDEYVLDSAENSLYSTASFTFLESFEMPVYPSGTSIDGQEIFGTNNDPDWQITNESPHKKEAVILNRDSNELTEIETLGYPHVIFQNYSGDIFSISKGLKAKSLTQNYSEIPSIFVEKIQRD